MTLFRHLSLSLVALLANTILVRAETDRADSWLENLDINAVASGTWVKNASRTSFAPTRENAWISELSLDAFRHQQLAPNWQLNLGLSGDYVLEPAYDRCSFFTLGPRAGLQHKFGLGPLAPVLQFDAAYIYKTARIRANNGWTAEAGVRLAKRLTPSLRVAASGRWLEHYANSATFDIQQRTITLEADWDINAHWRFSGSAGRLTGRVVAGAAPEIWAQAISGGLGPTIASYYTSIPREVTDAYEHGWVSYNVEARANLWSTALAYALSERTSLELRYSSAYIINKVNVRYPTDSWGLSLLHRF